MGVGVSACPQCGTRNPRLAPALPHALRMRSAGMSRLAHATKERLGLELPTDHVLIQASVAERHSRSRRRAGTSHADQPLGVALEQAGIGLRIGDCADDVRQAIANKIIQLAKIGERNPDVLCERA
jgi:hypothetical protein